MNKDVIYIEPEDDITDIILKIENSKEKIVALVPPKKAGVLRSVVNIKLIAKAGVSADKTVVLVTVDPSITKLAATTKIPVAKNLQTAPEVPKLGDEESVDDSSEKEDLVEDGDDEEEEEKDEKSEDEEENSEKDEDDEQDEEEEGDEEEEEKDEKKSKKEKKEKKSKKSKKTGGLKNWIKNHKKLAIFAFIAGLAIIGLLIWMIFIAPAVDITVSIKTEKKNFSENVTFVDKLEDENAEEGKFFLEQKKIEETQKIEFDATGKKNIGEKAHGTLKLSAYFDGKGSVAINGGKTQFTYNGLTYIANKDVGLSWDGMTPSDCDKFGLSPSPSGISKVSCLVSANIEVTAIEGGAKYNVPAAGSGWSTLSGINVVSITAMEGGTDDVITVVQQSDVIAAQNQIKSSKEEENKEKLFEKIKNESGDKYYIIESSFEQSISDDVITPAVDEKVGEGVQPSLEVKTTSTVYVIDKIKLEEYVDNKAKLGDDQKTYKIENIYIENMSHIAVGVTTKLKAQYFVGPKVTKEELIEKIKGKGLGDANREISDINGVSDVKIDKSYPWVMVVPTNSGKIKISFEVKDQDGNNIEQNDDQKNTEEEDSEEKKEESDDKKE